MEVLFGDLLSDCNTSKLHQVLLKITSDSNPVISSASLKLLKRLWLDSSLQQQFNVSLLYIHLIKIGLQFPVPLLISLGKSIKSSSNHSHRRNSISHSLTTQLVKLYSNISCRKRVQNCHKTSLLQQSPM